MRTNKLRLPPSKLSSVKLVKKHTVSAAFSSLRDTKSFGYRGYRRSSTPRWLATSPMGVCRLVLFPSQRFARVRTQYGLGFSFFPTRFYGWVCTTPVSNRGTVPSRVDWDVAIREAYVSSKSGVDFPHKIFSELVSVSAIYSARFVHTYLVDSLLMAKRLARAPHHNVIFKFNSKRLYLAVMDPIFGRNYFSLRPGLLLRYLEGRKKGAKHALPTKLLLMRLLRKLLIVSRLNYVAIIVKGVPVHLPQLFSFLNRPLSHRINDPVSGVSIDETGEEHYQFRYESVRFLVGKPYGYQKTRKRGRIKRKIRRKIISTARVVDEL